MTQEAQTRINVRFFYSALVNGMFKAGQLDWSVAIISETMIRQFENYMELVIAQASAKNGLILELPPAVFTYDFEILSNGK